MRQFQHLFLLAFILIANIAGTSVFAQTSTTINTNNKSISIKRFPVQVEIADNEELITQGLSDRDYLAPESGMLFVFPDTTGRAFWMYHCLLDLDIAFIDPEGVIKDIQTMTVEPLQTLPAQLHLYKSRTDNIKFVLEMNRNWFGDHNILCGDTLDVSDIKSKVKDASHWVR